MVALLAASAWVTVPFGPVPFTLQTLVLAMMPAILDPDTAILAVVSYVLVGSLGLPVFSSFMGGMGVLAGPTGGFLWGFVVGMMLAACIARVADRMQASPLVRVLVADTAMLAVSYACGTAQLMTVGAMGLEQALMVAVVPFVLPDAVKLVCGARVGCAAARGLGRLSR